MEFLRRRRTGVWLHWLAGGLLFATMEAGRESTAAWLFAAVTAVWLARWALVGAMARPGTTITGGSRAVHLAIHRTLYAAVGATAASGAVPQLAEFHEQLVFATLMLTAAHLLFALWRETIGDKILGRMF